LFRCEKKARKRGQATFSVRKKTVINRGRDIRKRGQENGDRPYFSRISPFSYQGKMGPVPIFFKIRVRSC